MLRNTFLAISDRKPELLIRPRLAIGPVNDPAEREAERVADQIMRMPVHTLQRAPVSIQRCGKCATATRIEEMCPSCAAKAHEESLLQRDAATDAVPEVTPEVEASISAMRGGGQPLAPELRAFMEPRFGHDFSAVRVHTDARAARTAADVGALAFTVGSDVAFGAGQYQPGTDAGKRLIAHELTHVVQQVQPLRFTVQRSTDVSRIEMPPVTFNVSSSCVREVEKRKQRCLSHEDAYCARIQVLAGVVGGALGTPGGPIGALGGAALAAWLVSDCNKRYRAACEAKAEDALSECIT